MMARKVTKPTKSKGERLGWTPIEKVKSVTLSAIVVKGHRVTTARHRDTGVAQNKPAVTFLIP
jgi:hypothetical protein